MYSIHSMIMKIYRKIVYNCAVILGVLLIIVALIYHQTNHKTDIEWRSSLFWWSTLIAIILSVPFLFDLISDYLATLIFYHKGYRDRTAVLFCFIISNVAMLSTYDSVGEFNLIAIKFIMNSQSIIILHFMLNYLIINCEFFVNNLLHFIIIFTLSMGIALSTFEISDPSLSLLFSVLSFVLFFVSTSLFLRQSIKWYFKRRTRLEHLTIEEYSSFGTIACFILMSIGILVVQLFYIVGFESFYGLIIIVNVTTLSCMFFLLMQGRIARAEALHFKNALESKKILFRESATDILAPLNNISVGSQLVLKDIGDHANKQLESFHSMIGGNDLLDVFNDVKESCDLAIDLVQDMLAHESLEDGVLALKKSPIKVWPLLKNSLRPFFLQATGAGITMELEYCATDITDITVDADKHKLGQVFRNLTTNAVKYTPRNGKITVLASVVLKPNATNRAVSVRRVAGSGTTTAVVANTNTNLSCESWLRIQFIDTGVGLTKENQLKIFKLQQQKQGRGGKGSTSIATSSGQGMMITKSIVELHGGYISVLSEGLGQGSTFTIDLPIMSSTAPSTAPSMFDKVRSGKYQSVFSYREAPRVYLSTDHEGGGTGGGGPAAAAAASNSFADLLSPVTHDDDISESKNQVEGQSRLQSPLKKHDWDGDLVTRDDDDDDDTTAVGGGGSGGGRPTRLHMAPPLVSPQHSGSVKKPRSCLVVDDARLNRKMMSRLLKTKFESITEAEDGLNAVEAVSISMKEGRPFDVILMDYHMPDMDGAAAAKIMRKRGYSGMIIGVSGNARSTDIALYIKSGADKVLPKPLDINLLERTLADVSAASTSDRESRDYKKSYNKQDSLFSITENVESSLPIRKMASLSTSDLEHALNHHSSIESSKLIELAGSTKAAKSGLRVLVVDDAMLNRKITSRMLRARNDSVTEAADGLNAVEAVSISMKEGRPFDVILMDYHMPDMDGAAAAKIMRKRGYDGVIIGVSGNAMPDDIALYVKNGADKVLPKPLSAHQLESTLAEYNFQLKEQIEL